MRNIFHSFATRLSLFLITVTGILFVMVFGLYFSLSRKAVTAEAFERSYRELILTTERIDATLQLAEQSLVTVEPYIQESLSRPDSLLSILKKMVASNPVLIGASVAFEPNYYPQKGVFFMPYVYREGDSIHSSILGGSTYNYHYIDWYLIPKLLNKDYWSEPYYDEGGGNMLMTTYTRLLHDNRGKFIGVITADLSLEWLTEQLASIKAYPKSYAYILSRNGYYLVHNTHDRILNETFFTATADMNDSIVLSIGRDMINGVMGMREFDNDSIPSYAFFAPISRIGWSVGVVSEKNDVLAQLDRMESSVMVVLIIGLILLFLITIGVINRVAAPLRRFAESARTIARGNFDTPLPTIRTQDEMAELRNAFSHMQSSLKEHIAQLQQTTAAKERIESELSIAHEIQMGMIPKVFPPFPDRNDIDLYAILHPAKEVGGDLYDFFVENDKLHFVIGDVSGKGVPASLLMAVTRSLFRSVATNQEDTAAIVSNMNHAIAESNESNMFVTLFVGILDLKTGKLNYCNAGHNPLVILSGDDAPHFLTMAPHIPIGVFDGFSFKEESTQIKGGDTLFLYTDGLTEAENKEKVLYGDAHLLEVLALATDYAPKALTQTVIESVTEHVKTNPQSDDLTLLIIQYKPQ